jgi:phage I-like protein
MKILIIAGTVALALCGCKSLKTAEATPPLRSEREYAERTEALAQELYKTGQAPSIEAARAQANADSNQEWAAAARAAQKKQSDEKMTKDLGKMKRDGY